MPSFAFVPLSMARHMYDLPYNPIKDFEYILPYSKQIYGPCAGADSPLKYAKANWGKIKYSFVALSIPNHFGMVYLAKAEKINCFGFYRFHHC